MSVQHARHVGALWVDPPAQITNDSHWLDDTVFTVMDEVGGGASQS